jgi:hypothetical protein
MIREKRPLASESLETGRRDGFWSPVKNNFLFSATHHKERMQLD